MSVSSREDFYYYEDYTSEWDWSSDEDEGPYLGRKTSKLIAAVVHNNVDILKEELDSPKWYNVKDRNGYSLLQIAILRHNKEVFDYMLSIPDFPLEFINENDETALMVALNEDMDHDEHFAYELLKMGACTNFFSEKGNTPLHRALYKSYDKVTLLLIKTGADVNMLNYDGDAPISLALSGSEEIFTALLVEGAVPSVSDFEDSVLNSYPLIVQELLFLHTIDQYSKIDFAVLLDLAENKSPFFHEILKCGCKIFFSDDNFDDFVLSCRNLCSLETDYLILIIQKCRKFVDKLLLNRLKWYWVDDDTTFRIENLDILLENKFEFDVIESLGLLNNGSNLSVELLKLGCDESRITEVYLYLLSYGLIIREQDLQMVYCQFGYCELFKLFLHMDIEQDFDENCNKDIVAVFIYDVTMTIPKFLKNYRKFSYGSISKLAHYFVHPSLTELFDQLISKGTHIAIRDKMPQVPRLLELARNSFRNCFIDIFKIKTTRKFYTLLKHLPISNVYKKIISYETKLY